VAAQPGVSVLLGENDGRSAQEFLGAARLLMREFAAGLCEVGGCTARSVCATLAEDGGAA
jgi:hypothetical protein